MGRTKFTRRALHAFAALTEFDAVIVDEATPTEHITRMRGKGINVIIAPSVTARLEVGAN